MITTNKQARAARAARTHAISTHWQYPQYDGHWDGWVAVRMTERIRTKAGTAFKWGDITIASPTDCGMRRTVYSFRTGMDTLVRSCWVEGLQLEQQQDFCAYYLAFVFEEDPTLWEMQTEALALALARVSS